MKNISVFICKSNHNKSVSRCRKCQNELINIDLFYYASNVICEEYNLINFVFEYDEALINKSFIKKVLQYEKIISRKKNVKFYNTIRIKNNIPKNNEIKFCKKHNIFLDIVYESFSAIEYGICNSKQKNNYYDSISITNYFNDDILHVYKFLKQYCKTLKLKQINLSGFLKSDSDVVDLVNKFKEIFDMWIIDKNGIDIKPISDHIRNHFGICFEKDCVNSSCLGKAVTLDSNGVVHMCPYSKNDKFVLGNIKNISLLSELFNSERFKNIVSIMIAKRKVCIKNCEIFNYCQSGCCMDVVCETFSTHYCEVLRKLDLYVCNYVQKIIERDEDLSKYNPVLTNIIKDVICYNPISINKSVK